MATVRTYPNYPMFRQKTGVMPDFSGSRIAYEEEPYGEKDGSNRNFKLMHQPLSDSLEVYKDGMRMRKDNDYTLNISNREIRFSSTQIPQPNSIILANYKHY